MRRDPFILDALEDALGATVSRYASVRDDHCVWLRSDEELFDRLGVGVTIRAELHPGDAADAARDLLEGLAARGLSIQRVTAREGNSLATRMVRLATALVAASGDPAWIRGIADAMCALAAEAQDRDDAVIPAHLRQDPTDMPAGVVRLDDHRRARA